MEKNAANKKISKYIKFGIYLAIIVLLNLALNLTPPGKIDLTSNGLFSISKASKAAVKTLNEPLTIKVFFTDNLSAPYNGIKPYINDILKEYADNANRKYFNYEFIDVGGSGDSSSEKIQKNRALAADYRIAAENIQAIDKDEASFKLAYMGMAFIHGDVIESITPIQSTDGLEFRITSTIKKMNNKISALLAMDKNIQVKLYHSSGIAELFEKASIVTNTVKKVIDTINKQNYGKVDLVVVDPTKEPDKAAEAEALNAYAFSKGTTKYFSDLFVMHNGKTEEIKVLELAMTLFGGYDVSIASEETLQGQINDAITALLNTNQKIGYIVNNDTLPLNTPEQNPYGYPPQQPQEGITNFKDIIGDEYTLVEVNLDETGIPEGINCIILGGPKSSFTDYQLYQIDQFLMQGKSLAVFMDGLKMVAPDQNSQLYGGQQKPQFLPNQTGIDTLLAHYGVKVEPSYVYDEAGYKQVDQTRGRFTAYQIPVVQNDKLNSKIDFVKDIRGVILYAISPLSVDDAKLKENNINAKLLFSSSNKSWTQNELPDQQTAAFMTPPFDDSEKKSYPLAYILEGKFKSYYADKPIPAKPEKQPAEGEDPAAQPTAPPTQIAANDVKITDKLVTTGEPGKVFVIGSSFVLDNQIFNSNISQNMLMYLNIIDYLNNRGDYAVMRTKLQSYNPLNPTTAGFKNFTKIFNIGVLPVLFVLIGIFVFFQRKAKKARIQQLFSKSNTSKEEV